MRHSVEKNTLLVCQRGLTLVELIVSMVIISIALGGVLMVMNFTVSHSADPMIQHQAVAIAEAYMEEILLQGYSDPDGGYSGAERKYFDDVDDYNSLPDEDPAKNQNGLSVGLDAYKVTVTVKKIDEDASDALGPDLNKVESKKITVTVNHSAMGDLILTGYRTNY